MVKARVIPLYMALCYDVKVEVADLTNQDGSAAGTRVIIAVPEIE